MSSSSKHTMKSTLLLFSSPGPGIRLLQHLDHYLHLHFNNLNIVAAMNILLSPAELTPRALRLQTHLYQPAMQVTGEDQSI